MVQRPSKLTLGERWVYYVGKQATQSLVLPWMFLLAACAWFALAFMLYQTGQDLVATLGVNEAIAQQTTVRWIPFCMTGVLFLLIALAWFERRWFYQIIEQQDRQLKELAG